MYPKSILNGIANSHGRGMHITQTQTQKTSEEKYNSQNRHSYMRRHLFLFYFIFYFIFKWLEDGWTDGGVEGYRDRDKEWEGTSSANIIIIIRTLLRSLKQS